MKEQKYSKEFESWYRNVLLPPIQCDGDLFRYFKHHAWKAWNAGRSRLKSNDLSEGSDG